MRSGHCALLAPPSVINPLTHTVRFPLFLLVLLLVPLGYIAHLLIYTCSEPLIMPYLRHLFYPTERYNFNYQVQHMPRHVKVVAGAASRPYKLRGIQGLSQALCQTYGGSPWCLLSGFTSTRLSPRIFDSALCSRTLWRQEVR